MRVLRILTRGRGVFDSGQFRFAEGLTGFTVAS
jgi:hypothetical protein